MTYADFNLILLLNKARHILFLVTGKKKSQMLETVLTAPFTLEKYPAQLIKSDDNDLQWFVDKEAASDNMRRLKSLFV